MTYHLSFMTHLEFLTLCDVSVTSFYHFWWWRHYYVIMTSIFMSHHQILFPESTKTSNHCLPELPDSDWSVGYSFHAHTISRDLYYEQLKQLGWPLLVILWWPLVTSNGVAREQPRFYCYYSKIIFVLLMTSSWRHSIDRWRHKRE